MLHFWLNFCLLYLHWFWSYNDCNAKLCKFLMYQRYEPKCKLLSALDSFWLAAVNGIRCSRWRHSNINGTSYSDDVKLEKLFINNGMSWKR
jgi:hypothetical protein